jgi:predicted amidophosphoribosyltransferase
MVHQLKYGGMEAAGSVLAALMAPRVHADVKALVPVPRARWRRVRFGVDPALVLADSLAELTGIPVVPGLAAAMWWPSHAGSTRARRQAPHFRSIRELPVDSVLVDDVLTTGATLVAAAKLSGCRRAVTATRAESRCLE